MTVISAAGGAIAATAFAASGGVASTSSGSLRLLLVLLTVRTNLFGAIGQLTPQGFVLGTALSAPILGTVLLTTAASRGIASTSGDVISPSYDAAPDEDIYFWSDQTVNTSGSLPGTPLSSPISGMVLISGTASDGLAKSGLSNVALDL